VYRFQGEDEYS